MVRCDCSGSRCNCVVTGGTGIVVDGSGEPSNPYVVSQVEIDHDIAGLFAVRDTESLDLTLAGQGTTSEPFVLSGQVLFPEVSLGLNDLIDVDVAEAETGDALVFDGANWVPGQAAAPVVGTVRTNYIVNPSFETGTTGWTAGTATLARITDAAVAPCGDSYLRVTSTAAGTLEVLAPRIDIADISSTSPNVAGSVQVRAVAGRAMVRVDSYDTAGGLVATGQEYVVDQLSTFQTISYSETVASDRAQLVVGYADSVASGVVLEVDCVLLERGLDSGDYFDGDTPDTPDCDFAWVGEEHASESIAVPRITVATADPIVGDGSATDPITLASGESLTVEDGELEVSAPLLSERFGEPQHEDGAIFVYPDLLDFGPVNEPPPVVTANASRNLDLVAHWYNDFGLDKQALAANQAAGAYLWYDWRWNFPTNTGDGVTSFGYDPRRHPLQGFYKGDDPRVLGWQCKWLAEAGINAVSLVQTDGFRRTNTAGLDWSAPANGSYWIYRLFNETPNFAALRWVAWLDSTGTATELSAQVDELIWLWENYPNGYTYTENDKVYAVVFLWDGELLRGALDAYNGATNTLVHLRTIASKFQTLGYDGVMVMARNAGLVDTNYDSYGLADDGVLYGYANYSEMYSPPDGDSFNDDYAQYAEKVVFPTHTAGRGRRVIGVQTAHESVYPHPSNFAIAGSTPEAFGLVLRRAADHVVMNGMYRIITIGNVSEWAEQGPGLLPTVADGFGYADQVRSLPTYQAPVITPDALVEVVRGDVFAASGDWLVVRVAGLVVPANGSTSTTPYVGPYLTYLNNPANYVYLTSVSIEPGVTQPTAPFQAIQTLLRPNFPSARLAVFLYNPNAAAITVTLNIMVRRITIGAL